MTHDKNIYLTSSYSPAPIYLQHGDQITVPFTKNYNNMDCSIPRKQHQQQKKPIRQIRPLHMPETTYDTISTTSTRQRSNSVSSISSNYTTKKQKPNNRDILTDDEKRVNHIASEQKKAKYNTFRFQRFNRYYSDIKEY